MHYGQRFEGGFLKHLIGPTALIPSHARSRKGTTHLAQAQLGDSVIATEQLAEALI